MIQIILVLSALAMLIGSNVMTYGLVSDRYKAEISAANAQAELASAKLQQDLNARLDAAVDWYEDELAKKVKERVVIKREVQRVVESNPVYVNCRLDDDGVRVLNAAADGVPVEFGSKPVGPVPQVSPQGQPASDPRGVPANGGQGLRPIPRLSP